jgi:hypothetical protein
MLSLVLLTFATSLSFPESIQGNVQKVVDEIWRIQHPQDCKHSRLLLMEFEDHFEGIGSVIASLASALAEGYYANRTVVRNSWAISELVIATKLFRYSAQHPLNFSKVL